MAGSKQTFKFRDPRETRLLNQASKDQYGRQRNHVLYGFEWAASGSNRNGINLGRGAIYTQDGVKIFFDDEISFKIPTINPAQGLTGGIVVDFPYPKNIIIGIQHNFVASATAQEAKIVLIEVRTSQKDQEPAYYIQEIDTITLTPLSSELIDPDRPAYNALYDTKPGGDPTTINLIATQKLENSIPNNVTPILKVRIQQLHQSGVITIPPYLFTTSGQLEDGVEIVRYKNMWQQLNDIVGVNIFEPVISSDLNSIEDLTYPTDKRATQDFVKNSAVTLPVNEQNTPTQHPLFGSFDPNVANNYAGYRFASFLMDGRSVLEGMKRIDAWLRLLVNRTGEQQLVDLTDSLTELNDIVNQGKPLIGDQNDYGGTNFMLREGKVYHVDPGNGPTYGDTHRRALHFLDMSINYICNRLGLTPMMTRAEIEIDNVTTPELWDVTNPPGLDITANMDFHIALQTLRDYFTSRGNDVITGRHIYSIIDTDRDQSGGDPPGQKTIIDNQQLTITDDTEYIQLKKGEIDSSDNRSDKINGVEVATLDSDSRYKINKIASHDPARSSANQGPLLEGVINASQGRSLIGALENIFDYNPIWNVDQLQYWANKNTVTHDGNGGLSLVGAAALANAFAPDTFLSCKGIDIEWYFDLSTLVMPSAGPFTLRLRFYDGSFNIIPSRDIIVLTQNASVASLYANGKIIDGVGVGVNKPAAAVFFKVLVDYAGSGSATFKLRFGSNVSNSPILVNTPTGSDPRTLTRKDYVDAQDALAFQSSDITYDGTNYKNPSNQTIGKALKIVVNGTDRFVPSWDSAAGNCHGNCHNDCHGDACNVFAV